MRLVRFLAVLVLVVMGHAAGVRLSPVFPRVIDLFLIWVVLNALDGETLPGMLRGTAAGLLYDTLSAGPFGLFGFADTIVGYGTARLAQRLVIKRGTGVFGVVALAVLAQQFVVTALAFLVLPEPKPPGFLWTLIRGGGCGALGAGVFVFLGIWSRHRARRRRHRTKRLRIEAK